MICYVKIKRLMTVLTGRDGGDWIIIAGERREQGWRRGESPEMRVDERGEQVG